MAYNSTKSSCQRRKTALWCKGQLTQQIFVKMVGLHCKKKEKISIASCFTLIHIFIRSHLYWIKLFGQMGNFTATVCKRTSTISTDEWSKQLVPQRRGGGGGGKGEGCWQYATNLYPESHEEYPEVKCFAFWTTHCFTKRVWKIYIYRLPINIFLSFLWARWGEDDFIRRPVISWKPVVMHCGEYFWVNLWVCPWQQGSPVCATLGNEDRIRH